MKDIGNLGAKVGLDAGLADFTMGLGLFGVILSPDMPGRGLRRRDWPG